jgi:hypothetical protein
MDRGKSRPGEDTTDAEARCTIPFNPLPAENGVDLCVSALSEERIVKAEKMSETLDYRVGGSDVNAETAGATAEGAVRILEGPNVSGRFLMGPGGRIPPGIQGAMK